MRPRKDRPSIEEPKKHLQKFEDVFSPSNLRRAYKMSMRRKRWKKPPYR